MAQLTDPDSRSGSNFGVNVAIDEDTIVSGAYYAITTSNETRAVYVFEKPDLSWVDATEDIKLTATDISSIKILGQSIVLSQQNEQPLTHRT